MATLVSGPVKTRIDDQYFVGISVAMLVAVVAGFSRTYFFKGMFFAPLPTILIHIHGAVFSSWIILFVAQTVLVAKRNLRLHRKLGYAGAVLAGLMVVLGVTATVWSVSVGHTPSIFTPSMFLALNGLGLLYFGSFVAWAVIRRNNGPIHKRLMLFATFNLLPPATTRLFTFIFHAPALNTVTLVAFALSVVVFDLISRRKTYTVTVIGTLVDLSTFPLATALGHVPLLQRIAASIQHS
jgi:uncharacterized membrane protein YozB (DUF420 family)